MKAWIPQHTDAEVETIIADQKRGEIRELVLAVALAIGDATRHAKYLAWEIDGFYRPDDSDKLERAADFDRISAGLGAILAHASAVLDEIDRDAKR